MELEGPFVVTRARIDSISRELRSWETERFPGSDLLVFLPEEFRKPYLEMLRTWLAVELIRKSPREYFHPNWRKQFLDRRKFERTFKNRLWDLDLWKVHFGWGDSYLVGLISLSGSLAGKTERRDQKRVFSRFLAELEHVAGPEIRALIPKAFTSVENSEQNLRKAFSRTCKNLRDLGYAEAHIYLQDLHPHKMCGRISLEGGDPEYLAASCKGWLGRVFPIPLDHRVKNSYYQAPVRILTAGSRVMAEANPSGPYANVFTCIGSYTSEGKTDFTDAKKKRKHGNLLLPSADELLSFIEAVK